jgi:hypothetical protein
MKSRFTYCILFIGILSNLIGQTNFYIPFRVQDKWGFSDYNGKLLIEAKYDKIDFFYNYNYLSKNIAKVYKDNKVGLIDTSGKYIIPIYAQNLSILRSARQYEDAILVELNNKFGVVNYKNQLIIPLEFDKIQIENDWKKDNRNILVNQWFYYAKKGEEYFKITKEGSKSKIDKSTYLNTIDKDNLFDERDIISGESYNRIKDTEKRKIQQSKDSLIFKNKDLFDSIGTKTYGDYVEVFLKGKVGLVDQIELLNVPKVENLIKPTFDYVSSSNKYSYVTPEFFFLMRNDSSIIYNSDRKGYNMFGSKPDKNVYLKPFAESSFIPYKIEEVERRDFFKISNGNLIGLYNLKKNLIIEPKYKYVEFNYSSVSNPKLWLVGIGNNTGYINENGFEYFVD